MNALLEPLDLAVHDLVHALDAQPMAVRLMAGDVDAHEYAAFLVQTFLYVRYTRPLLRRAGERMIQLGQTPSLARLFLQKADEEQGHDHWVLADLDAIGFSLDARRWPKASTPVAAYIAWNEFQVDVGWPLGFLGTAYILESVAFARAGRMAENLVKKNRIPGIANGVRFLQGHAEADEHHIDELQRVLSALPSASDQAAIALSAAVTATLYLGMFSALDVGEQNRQAA